MIYLALFLFSISAIAENINGRAIFDSQCRRCHTFGGGDDVAPDLLGIHQRRDRSWLKQWISAPEKVIASQDKYALELLKTYKFLMPNLYLSEKEIDGVIDYLAGIGQGVWIFDPLFEQGSPPAQITFYRETHSLFFEIPKSKSSCYDCHTYMHR